MSRPVEETQISKMKGPNSEIMNTIGLKMSSLSDSLIRKRMAPFPPDLLSQGKAGTSEIKYSTHNKQRK